ncbi:AREL1 [Cordylochernes scorpioides]|uniref:AREL1 n=1 Tax=Cordylochernes scorpioides TaxID=51811 RepID=A0ABY6K422_9ARAC|nr:AREL1 [Cordylochernes scorpioides]
MDLKSPKELEILGNLSENWKRFKQRFEIYFEGYYSEKKIEDYCDPLKNTTYERYVFFTTSQNVGEGIESYVMELKKKKNELAESLIKDRLICGMLDDTLRERLLKERDLNLAHWKYVKFMKLQKSKLKISVIIKVQMLIL